LAAAEFLPAVRNSQVLQQVVNGKALALVIRMIGLPDESIIFIIDVGKIFYFNYFFKSVSVETE
jgi:hypothetical protein